MEQIVTLVGQMGWPIASAIMCFWFCFQLITRSEAERKEEREAHSKEMEAITQAINANTLVLEALKERLGYEE